MDNLSQSKSAIRPTLLVLWLLAVAVVVYAISIQDTFFAKSIPVVAEISKPHGDVVFRSESKVRWNAASAGTSLFDGDRVSTGRGSSALVQFKDGRKLALGEDSQVIISTITHSDSGVTFLVNLVKGTVVADSKSRCKNCRDLVLRSGGESFTVKKGKKEGFFRDVAAAKIEKFAVTGPTPIQSVVAPAPAPVIEEPVKEEPKKEEPKKVAVISAGGYEYSVRPPVEGLSIWTHKSVSSLFGARLSIPLVSPLKTPPFKNFVPIIEVSDLAGSRREIIAGSFRGDNAISLPIVKLRMLATQRYSGINQYAVTIRGGIRVTDGPKPVESLSGNKITVAINTIGEPIGIPIALGFDRLSYQAPEGNWIPPKTIVPVSTTNIQVTLFGAGDFAKMIPFAVGASKFGTLTGSQVSTPVANIVRDGYIIAQIVKYTSQDDIRTILTTLGGTFAFVGPRSLYQYSTGNSQDNVVNLVDDLLDKGKVLFFFKNKKLYPVNRTFIKDSKEVANFLGKQANMFFTEKVEIINR